MSERDQDSNFTIFNTFAGLENMSASARFEAIENGIANAKPEYLEHVQSWVKNGTPVDDKMLKEIMENSGPKGKHEGLR